MHLMSVSNVVLQPRPSQKFSFFFRRDAAKPYFSDLIVKEWPYKY